MWIGTLAEDPFVDPLPMFRVNDRLAATKAARFAAPLPPSASLSCGEGGELKPYFR